MGYVLPTTLRLLSLGALACGTAAAPTSSSPATTTATAVPTNTSPPPTAASRPAGVPAIPQVAGTPAPTLDSVEAELRRELRAAGISIGAWKTDFSNRSVPLDEIISGGPPRDGIPPLDHPAFTTVAEADAWLDSLEPVVFFQNGGDARAYPLQIMTWHEIVNDEAGGTPVCVTFCPLCNFAIVFDRRLGGVVYDFGTSGNLRNSDLIMWDRQTESWWQQLTGEAIVGELTGQTLTFLPAGIIAWENFKANHPQGKVLSRDTGFNRNYGSNPYVGYDRVDNPPFLYQGELDGRLLPKERVAAVSIGEVDAAYPLTVLAKERVVNDAVNGQDWWCSISPAPAAPWTKSSSQTRTRWARRRCSIPTWMVRSWPSTGTGSGSPTRKRALPGTCWARAGTARWRADNWSPSSTPTISGSPGRPSSPIPSSTRATGVLARPIVGPLIKVESRAPGYSKCFYRITDAGLGRNTRSVDMRDAHPAQPELVEDDMVRQAYHERVIRDD